LHINETKITRLNCVHVTKTSRLAGEQQYSLFIPIRLMALQPRFDVARVNAQTHTQADRLLLIGYTISSAS